MGEQIRLTIFVHLVEKISCHLPGWFVIKEQLDVASNTVA